MVQVLFNMFVEVALYEVYSNLNRMCETNVVSSSMAFHTDAV